MERTGTVIRSKDFDRLVSEVSAGVWNQLTEKTSFDSTNLTVYAEIFEAVAETLGKYRAIKSKSL